MSGVIHVNNILRCPKQTGGDEYGIVVHRKLDDNNDCCIGYAYCKVPDKI